jgi:AbrB family looped-hinge helix DNA binding protein
MQTRVSTKGQVVIPGALRRKLGIRPGDPLDVAVEESRIVLTVRKSAKRNARIIDDPITGLPVLVVDDPNAPVITSREIEELLAEFP